MDPAHPTALLILATENAELRVQLAELQEQLVEAAVDAGELHTEVEELRARLAAVEVERDIWRAEAERRAAWFATGCGLGPADHHSRRPRLPTQE